MLSRARVLFASFALLLFASSATAATGVKFGGQLDIADDYDFGLGVRALMDTESIIEHTRFAGSFDLYFPDGPVDFWELNANGHYQFNTPDVPVRFYAGTGLHIGHVSVDSGGSDTKLGLNILGGMDIPTNARVEPYIELRIELGGAEQFVFTAGLTF